MSQGLAGQFLYLVLSEWTLLILFNFSGLSGPMWFGKTCLNSDALGRPLLYLSIKDY
jgi:hypothetical protein